MLRFVEILSRQILRHPLATTGCVIEMKMYDRQTMKNRIEVNYGERGASSQTRMPNNVLAMILYPNLESMPTHCMSELKVVTWSLVHIISERYQ
jgi:hypothetical protein